MPTSRDSHSTSILHWLSPGRRRATSAVEREIEALHGLLEAAPVAIVAQSQDGLIATWNRAAERLFGWSSAEVLGQASPMIAPEARAADVALRHRILAGNTVFRMPQRLRHRSGEALELAVSSAPRRDAAGNIVGVVSVFEDPVPGAPAGEPASTTPPRNAQSINVPAAGPARPASANPAQLLAQVNHDLRQPLHALGLLTGALERRGKDAESRALAQNAGALVQGLQKSLDDIVDLARLENGQIAAEPVVVRVRDVMRPVAEECARAARERGVAFRYIESGASIRVDPILLQRILRHLLSNAVKFAERGDGRKAKVLLGARRRSNQLRIVVADSGIGIPVDQAASVFEPFVQLDPGRAAGGLGLGLAIARRLARLLRTDIAMHSVPGMGSQFWVEVEHATAGHPPS